MNKIVNLFFVLHIIYSINAFAPDSVFLRTNVQKPVNNSSSEYPPMCDVAPSTNIDPEKCCQFPNFFDDSIVKKCEEENELTDKSIVGDMVSDSCLIECMFNKSGLTKSPKLQHDDVLKIMNNKTKSDNVWNQLITKAVDVCFNELSEDDIEEIAEHIKTEVGKNTQSAHHKICHPGSSIMLDCIFRELYKVCPKEKFSIDNPECSTLQNYTITCDDW
ncbi:odorant-binding protein 47-like [Chironomus tepperi]|uniref:odorant-binding protein 47-like n=1 Tax=Chironomus tepperi TaxID=113505 RepID=UPI00391FC4AD